LQNIKDKHADQIELCENSVTKPSYIKKNTHTHTHTHIVRLAEDTNSEK